MSLKAELEEFDKLFKKHLNSVVKATIRWVTVVEVDWDEKTMTALNQNGLAYYEVMLGLGSQFTKPVEGTDCLIAIVEGRDAIAFLLHANEVEEIVFDGGKNGGLVKVKELQEQLNKITARIDGVIKAITNAKPVVDNSGAGLLASMVVGLKTIVEKEDFKDIENEKIKH